MSDRTYIPLLQLLFAAVILSVATTARTQEIWSIAIIDKSDTSIGKSLSDSLRNVIDNRSNTTTGADGRGHHIRLFIDTHNVLIDGEIAGSAVSFTTVLMIKNLYSQKFVPIFIDTSVGYCTIHSVRLCVLAGEAKIENAAKYSDAASQLIRNVSTSVWERGL